MTAPASPVTGPVPWLRQNLFPNPRNSVITIITAGVLAVVAFRTLRFVFVTGRWTIVRVNLGLFLYGRYPRDQLWRVALAAIVIALIGGLVAGMIWRGQRDAAVEAGTPSPPTSIPRQLRAIVVRTWPILVVVAVLLVFSTTVNPALVTLAIGAAALLGRFVGPFIPRRVRPVIYATPAVVPLLLLPFLTSPFGWDDWGGIMLTLLLAGVSMLACFPLGLALAIGRRSTMPAIRAVSVGFIEFFRGVPLVVLVLMSAQALGFFFPQSILPGNVVRVMIVFTIFTAAYVAEIVRGGLQSIPRGQTEAAQALGLSPVRTMGLVVLPQALRNVIPALVGQFISLFKDTTLVFTIGLLDPLTVADGVTKQREFELSNFPESLAFAALLFWVGAFTLSRESQRLEARLDRSTR